jgi:hypothetical protein
VEEEETGVFVGLDGEGHFCYDVLVQAVVQVAQPGLVAEA